VRRTGWWGEITSLWGKEGGEGPQTLTGETRPVAGISAGGAGPGNEPDKRVVGGDGGQGNTCREQHVDGYRTGGIKKTPSIFVKTSQGQHNRGEKSFRNKALSRRERVTRGLITKRGGPCGKGATGKWVNWGKGCGGSNTWGAGGDPTRPS